MKNYPLQLDLMVDESIALSFKLMKVYPFKNDIVKLFKKCVEVPFNLECIDFCNTFITFHGTFMIFLCVNNIREVMV
jgi:hypothetical protein